MDCLIIAKGELWLHRTGLAPQQITSAFAREVVERDERSRRNTSWKHAPREQQTGVIPTNTLWGSQQSGPLAPPRFLLACFGAETNILYYVLSIGETVGLFRLHLDEEREVRLFHRHGIQILGLAFNPADQRLILSVRATDGTAQLEVYDDEGTLKGAVTGGDSIDAAPALVPGAKSALVFQSSGVARHPERGHVAAIAHATLNRLDYRGGQLETLADESAWDFLAPRIAADGTVYAIRRPIEKPPHERAGAALTDTVLMPIRLLKAVFGYLNFFTTIYGKEPLRSAGGPRTPELDQDLGRLWLHGRMIELRKVRDDPKYSGNLVPASWELVRRAPGGSGSSSGNSRSSWEVVTKHVAAFDLTADGAVVYTRGFDVVCWRDGREEKVGRHELVEYVSVALAS